MRFTFVQDSARADVHVTWIDRFNETISGKTLWARDENGWIVEANIVLALHHCGGEALDSAAIRAIAARGRSPDRARSYDRYHGNHDAEGADQAAGDERCRYRETVVLGATGIGEVTRAGSSMDDDLFDAAIVGGGPAGLTAALWLGRYLHRAVVIDSGDPRNWETREVNGFPGLPHVRPSELRGGLRDECRELGISLVDGFVTRVLREDDERFVLEFDPIDGTKAGENRSGPGTSRTAEDNAPTPRTERIVARRLLLAFGLRDEWPQLPGLEQIYGATAHVCPDCDGYAVRDSRVVVIASGRRAAGMALDLTTWTRDLVICTNGRPPDLDEQAQHKLAALQIPIVTAPIVCVHPRGRRIHSLEFEGGDCLECDHIRLSQRPADDLGAQLGCERDEHGHVVVDAHWSTSVQHVFAAGDITPGSQLAIRAAAGGATAALAIHKSLVPGERRLT